VTPRDGTATADVVGAWSSAARGPQPEEEAEPVAAPASLLDAVTDLRRDVEATRLPLPLDGVDHALLMRRRVIDQLDDHLLPRLRFLSTPGIVVIAGSTGAGKSTLINSLLGTEISAAGVIRPTTRQPVLAHHPADADLLGDHPLLEIVDVVGHEAVPRGLTLVDAPDLDSLLVTNRAIAHRLLEAADLWLFVTTAARYGDAVPWEMLDRAAERGTAMAMVLNRVPDEASVIVRGDLTTRLRERGLTSVPLFLIPDLGPHEGMLAPAAVAPIKRWLAMVAGPDRARSVIARTQRGALRSLRPWVDELAEAVQAQVDARKRLEKLIRNAVVEPATRAEAEVSGGAVVSGPVRARWAGASSRSGALSRRWTTRRGRAHRSRALVELGDALHAAASVTFAAGRRAGETALDTALRGPEAGAAAVLDAMAGIDAREAAGAVDTPDQSAADWLRAAGQRMRVLTNDADKRVARRARRLLAGVGEDGAGTLVALAAAGLGGVSARLDVALGRQTTDDVVGRTRTDLATRVAEQVRAATVPPLAVLDVPDLADDAASRLRLRLAVLKGLLR